VPVQLVDRIVDVGVDAGERDVVRRRAWIVDDRGDELARRVGLFFNLILHLLVSVQTFRVDCLVRRVLHFGDDHPPQRK
jgi:hypothetical protein